MLLNEQTYTNDKATCVSPQNETVIELDIQQTFYETQLDQIQEELEIKEQLQISERYRLEKLKNIPIHQKNRLSTIKELSDLSSSSQQVTENEISDDNPKSTGKKKLHEKRVSKNLKIIKKSQFRKRQSSVIYENEDLQYYSSLNLSKYYKDNTVDCRWKLLFTYYAILIASNIILNIIELVRYQESFCALEGFDNTLIFINQIFYVVCKVGILSITYQEFTNTLPIKVEIPLINQVVFSCVFPVLSMPLYIYDFVQCQYRIEVFTLDQSLNILNLIDWLLLSIIVIIILCLILQNMQNQKYWILDFIMSPFISLTNKNCLYLKVMAYASLIGVHCISIIMTIGQSFDKLQPAMIMENYYSLFSLLLMFYLSVYKFCFNRIPFLSKADMQKQNDEIHLRL